MTHQQALSRGFRGRPGVDCPGELRLRETFPDRHMGRERPIERTIYVHECDRCGHVVSLAREHVPDVDAVRIDFELLNSYPIVRRMIHALAREKAVGPKGRSDGRI